MIALCAVLLLAAGCKGKEQPVDPFNTAGTTENPNWVLTVENDMSASMTAMVKVSFAQSEGTLAAFIGSDCCGIAEYNADLGIYSLYVSPGKEEGGNVQLRFYSPELKRIFNAKETIPFSNDNHLGSVAEPYTPIWEVAE